MPGFRPEAAFQELRDPRAPEVARKSFSPGQNAPVGESTGYRLRTEGHPGWYAAVRIRPRQRQTDQRTRDCTSGLRC